MKKYKSGKCGMPPMPPRGDEPNSNPVKLCHDITRLSRAKAREVNIDGVMSQPGARLVLAFLAYEDGVTQRTLVERTHLRAPTISVILGKMEDEGMVERRQNPVDKRETYVYITDHGRQTDQNAIEKIRETDALAVGGLTEDEIQMLLSLLSRMRSNLINALDGKKTDGEEEGE